MQDLTTTIIKAKIVLLQGEIDRLSGDVEGNKKDLAQSYTNLGIMHLQLGEDGEACRFWEKAVNNFDSTGALGMLAKHYANFWDGYILPPRFPGAFDPSVPLSR